MVFERCSEVGGKAGFNALCSWRNQRWKNIDGKISSSGVAAKIASISTLGEG